MSDENDELISDLEEDVPDANVMHLGESLDPPEARLYTTQELHTLIHDGTIDLDPQYQRAVVWPEQKQIKLLDSLYRNFYVPPIVFAVSTDEHGEETRMCVDGKQRLTSIQKFMDGQIAYRDPITKKMFWYTRAESMKHHRPEVPAYLKQVFREKEITCVEYRNLPQGFERDIFQRVQMGMPLTAAEKLQAIASPWANWISDSLEARFIGADDGITSVIDVDMKRGRDFQSIAQFVYCCHEYPEEVIPTAQKIEKFLQREDEPPNSFKAAMHEVMTAFWHIANTAHLNQGFKRINKRVAPIEFVFIGVLLYVMRGTTYEARANAIYDMRAYVRSKYPDVRARGDIIKSLWEFIDHVDAEPSSNSRRRETTGSKKKRSRKQDSDDEDFDDYYSKSKKAASTSTRHQKGKRTAP